MIMTTFTRFPAPGQPALTKAIVHGDLPDLEEPLRS